MGNVWGSRYLTRGSQKLKLGLDFGYYNQLSGLMLNVRDNWYLNVRIFLSSMLTWLEEQWSRYRMRGSVELMLTHEAPPSPANAGSRDV